MTEKDVGKIRSKIEEAGPDCDGFFEALSIEFYTPIEVAAPWLLKGTWDDRNYRITVVHIDTKEIVSGSGSSMRGARQAVLDAIKIANKVTIERQ